MANLKEIRSRITSIGSTMQITNAMKMVSAAKLKKAQDAIEQMRPYANKMRELTNNLSGSIGDSVLSELTQVREVNNVLVIVVTSNRGLAGAFNSNVIKKAVEVIKEDYKDKKVSILTIGKKGNDLLKKEYEIASNQSFIWDNFTFAESSRIALEVMEDFKKGKYDEVRVIYNQFKNAATQIVTDEQFLPIAIDSTQEIVTPNTDYIFEPNKKEILQDLLPRTLKTQLFKALSDSFASEHGARMTAMHKATDNATDLQKELKLQYNKARQAAITNEITEIVGGADALSG
ncbi:ATP synthase F1 subunit gamma [Weeksellaceae bacterium TAE3-ERU29]|nr:ATP synthase F1 subunit gamma [Weeksellaceae bacterium TAE3-ERU29]